MFGVDLKKYAGAIYAAFDLGKEIAAVVEMDDEKRAKVNEFFGLATSLAMLFCGPDTRK